MADSEVRVTPPISGCAARQPQSRIPKLTPRTPKDEPKKASPRLSKLPTPKTVSSGGIRKSSSQLASNKNLPATSQNGTKPSASESTIARKAAKSSIKPPSSPRGLKLAVPSKASLPRLNRKNDGRQNHTEKQKSTEKLDERSLEDISDDIFERVCRSGGNITPLADEVAPPGFSDSDSADSLPESNHTMDLTEKGISDPYDVTKKPGIEGPGGIRPVVPPLDLNLLDDCDAVRAYQALEEERFLKEEKLLEELEKSEMQHDKRLAEEKQHLLDDMQSLKEKLERQQSTGSKESGSDKEQGRGT